MIIKANVNTLVRIMGCPRPGWDGANALDALDYRRRHGVPDNRADEKVLISGEITEEGHIRQLVAAGCNIGSLSDGSAMMTLGGNSPDFPLVCHEGYIKHGSSYGWLAEVPSSLLVRESGDDGEDLLNILLAVCADSPAKQDERLRLSKMRVSAKAEVARITNDLVLAQERLDALS